MRAVEEQYRPYLNFLRDLIDDGSGHTYLCLTRILFDKDFEYFVPMDSNRDFDGRELRYDFLDEMIDYDYDESDIPAGPARVLEVLIALSRRIEFRLYGSRYHVFAVDLFWEMVENLGLSFLNDSEIDENYVDFVYNTLDNWMISPRFGGKVCEIFPLKRRKKVVTSKNGQELWYQMMNYLEENYPI